MIILRLTLRLLSPLCCPVPVLLCRSAWLAASSGVHPPPCIARSYMQQQETAARSDMRIAVAWDDPVTSATSPPRIANITGVIIFGVAPVSTSSPVRCTTLRNGWTGGRTGGLEHRRGRAKRRLLFCDSDPGRAQTNRRTRDAG